MKDKVLNQIAKNMGKIRFYFKETYGLPEEIFDELKGKTNALEDLEYTLHFYLKNKKWCKKNNIIVYYKDII